MEMTTKKCSITKKHLIMGAVLLCMMAFMITVTPAFADPAVPNGLANVVGDFVFYIGLIFQVVGVLIGVYAAGQMIMAFKDDNPDAKTRASTLLVVAFILIVMPSIIKGLGLVNYITGK